MICLALSELSLSEQAAVQQSFAAAIAARYGDLLSTVSSATAPDLLPVAHPLKRAVAGESLIDGAIA